MSFDCYQQLIDHPLTLITAGWQEPRGHPRYPKMGEYFEVE